MRHVLTLLVVLFVAGCGGAAVDPCVGGDAYPDDGFATNAAAELALVARLEAVNDRLDAAGKDLTVKPTAAELQALFEAGTPSLASIVTPGFAATVPGIFAASESAAGSDWTPADPPTGTGGALGTVLFSARGVDVQEAFEKGVLAAGHFYEAQRLMSAGATAATVDRILALYGTTPTFPMDTKAAVNPDLFSAGYAKRRTNPAASTPGLYLTIKRAFIDARAAAAGGSACVTQRDAALAMIRVDWERAMVGTAVFYLNSASQKLEAAAATDADRASALHAYNEAVGFLKGLRTLDASMRTPSDAQLDEILVTLLAPMGSEPESHKLLTDTVTYLPRLGQAVTQLQAAWKFTPDEVANFKVAY